MSVIVSLWSRLVYHVCNVSVLSGVRDMLSPWNLLLFVPVYSLCVTSVMLLWSELVCHVCNVSVSCRIHDAASSQAHELCRGFSERPTEVSYEASWVYSTHHRATLHVLHSSRCRAWLPVSLPVNHDCIQLLLLYVSRSSPASCKRTVSRRFWVNVKRNCVLLAEFHCN